MKFKLYVEGGGPGESQAARFGEAWNNFFRRAGLAGRMPQVVRGKGRDQTFELFVTAVENPRPEQVPILLVDSECPVAVGHSVWQHLTTCAGWKRPDGTADNQAFLMVQVMETWLLADRKTLKSYFGSAFRENALKSWSDLEALSKETVFQSLDQATAACAKRYAKGKVSFELLGRLNPNLVEQACPQARALLARLRA